MIVKDGLYYTKTHEWVKVEDEVAAIGITDFAQNQLTDIVYVDLPKVDALLKKGDMAGTVESVKSAEDFYAPIGGKIVEVNKSLENAPEEINKNPYSAWLYKLRITDKSELSALLQKDAYEKLIK